MRVMAGCFLKIDKSLLNTQEKCDAILPVGEDGERFLTLTNTSKSYKYFPRYSCLFFSE